MIEMHTDRKIVSVIVVNYNTWHYLRPCLESIKEHFKPISYEIIVVDNNSTDNSPQLIKDHYADINLIENNENKGFAKANNQAIRGAKGEYLFLLNSDTLILNSGLSEIINYLERNPEVGIIGPAIFNENDEFVNSFSVSRTLKQHQIEMLKDAFYVQRLRMVFSRNHHEPSLAPFQVGIVNGSAMIVRKSALATVGLLDERFFFCAEEVDWCFRFNEAGFKVMYYPDYKVRHYLRSGQGINLWLLLQYHKSNIKLFKKYQGHPGEYLARVIFIIWILSRSLYSLVSYLFLLRERGVIGRHLEIYLKALIWHFTLEGINFNEQIR
ncbi:MAG: glycosyltransferase family 2 protein [Deltaproteobacteria bacterium]|nr:MAG: glycosyltransferase family 2 protein [Deltaproteobacteria bacterium]